MTEPDETGDERPEGFGPIDAGALREIRDLFVEREPFVVEAELDDPLNPQTLSIEFADGINDATAARFDVRWSVTGHYAFHYTDNDSRDFRFDCHPKPDAPTRHFHTPPDAPTHPVEPSCIEVTELPIVAQAVLDRWRAAYEEGTHRRLNDAENPP
ncbi:hypothetical protein [Halobellus ordinarius]|uniref:hypothetical protein n=1 Tax=Halobellus ordinarius TaxID=3075120 RepID=UPI002880A34E|nr:hypothetical protein [Halobellus sp. ZY16]